VPGNFAKKREQKAKWDSRPPINFLQGADVHSRAEATLPDILIIPVAANISSRQLISV
jgi:hypothetical protein